MIESKLFIRLVLPLLAIGLIGLIFIWPPRTEDLLYNFIVEISSILITVLFVDWRIKTYESEKWKHVDTLMKTDFASWSLKFIVETTTFIGSGGISLPEVDKYKSYEKSWGFALEHISIDNVIAAVYDTDENDREIFRNSLEYLLEDLLNLYTRHSSRLSPKEIEGIFDIETSLRSTIKQFKVIDDDELLQDFANSNAENLDWTWTKQAENTAKSLYETITLGIKSFGKFFPNSK